MKNSDRKEFVTMLVANSEVYGKEHSPALIDLYWTALKSYELSAVLEAFAKHVRSPDRGQFMPKPADIIRMIDGTSTDVAMVQWYAVERAVRNIGPYTSVTFDDQTTMKVIEEMGGWTLLCDGDEDEWPFIGNRFRALYHGYAARGEVPHCRPRLAGIAEAENSRKGFSTYQHALIGDHRKAGVIAAMDDPPVSGFVLIKKAAQKQLEVKP